MLPIKSNSFDLPIETNSITKDLENSNTKTDSNNNSNVNTNLLSQALDNTHYSTMGIFYKIKNKNQETKGYIYGTTHQVYDPGFKSNKKIGKKLDKSDHVLFEIDSLNLFFQKMDTSRDFNKCIKEVENIITHVRKHKNLILMDLELAKYAHQEKKNVVSLETAEEQDFYAKKYLEDLKIIEEKYRTILNLNEKSEEQKIFKKQFDEMAEIKFHIHKTSNEELMEKYAKYGFSEESLLIGDIRNAKMAEKIDSCLRESGKYFIAVGAGHVVGTGIVDLLRKKGWTLQKIV